MSYTTPNSPLIPIKDRNGKNITHCQFPQYAPFPNFMRPKLYLHAYHPRALLNYTVAAFHDRTDGELSTSQIRARQDFLGQFQRRNSFYGINAVQETAFLQNSNEDLLEFLKYMDEFFFFGLLRNRCVIIGGFDVVQQDPPPQRWWYDGTASRQNANGLSYVEITIDVNSRGTIHPLSSLLSTLMHEMVHAYFMLFACDCAGCDRDRLNTIGLPGNAHGPLFLMLHRLVLTELRRWGVSNGDRELSMLDAQDCPGESISSSTKEYYEYENSLMSETQRSSLNSVRPQQSPGYLIYFSADGNEVVVAPALKNNQIRLENSIPHHMRQWRFHGWH
ncbi:hypothetical protein F5B19DRAFT_501100 [Rostrohypoxylon terebratum]|nr:hypothetical protein F5B19DRAFT_501100 [Rostrohypoxylon terebratum]